MTRVSEGASWENVDEDEDEDEEYGHVDHRKQLRKEQKKKDNQQRKEAH